MEILLIIFLLSIVGIVLFLLFKILKWIFRKKSRMAGILFLLVSIGAGIIINKLFFVKMEFIQSKVYPDLFLVKNALEDKEALHKAIQEFSITSVKNQLPAYHEKSNSELQINYSMRFYEYYKSWNPLVFGDSGTAYFIENEEDLGGMVVEDLSMYPKLKLATFYAIICNDDTTAYCGVIHYFKDGYKIKSDTTRIAFPVTVKTVH